MAVTPTSGTSGSGTTSSSGALGSLDMDEFLKLLITELQNQDPLNPMDNAQMLQQISQIRTVEATDKMTKTMDAVLLGQTISNATSFVGKTITGLTDGANARRVTGKVDRVSITNGEAKLHVGSDTISLTNVAEVTGG